MTDAILLMLGTGVLWALVGVVFGSAPSDRDRMFSFFALYQLLFAAFVWIAQPPTAAPAGEVLRLAALMVPSGAMEIAAFLLLKLAMGRGSQGIAWSFSQSAMAVSFVCSVVFLGNPSTAPQWTGLALTLVALALFAKDKPSTGAASNDALYWRLVLGAFALIGAGQFQRLLPEYAGFSDATLTWRLPLMSPIGAVFWVSACAVKRIWKPWLVWKVSFACAAVVTLGQICFFAATKAAYPLGITSRVVPVAIGTCILLFALWCRFVRHERMSWAGWLAVAADIGGIALLSCG